MGRVVKPVDEAVRDLATEDTGRSMALSAGAGSGKTSVLTARLVNVLGSGVAPGRVAAITFTEKAAGELQRRVRDTMEERLRKQPDDVALRGQLERYHELTLSTVHSFCRALLATEPLASRWAPGTEIAERDTRGLAKGLTAWRRALANEQPLLLGLFDLRLANRSLREGAIALIGNRDLEPVVGEGLDWDAAHEELKTVHEAVEAAARGCSNPAKDKLLANNEDLRERLAFWSSQPAGEATIAAVVSSVKVGKAGGVAGDWVKGGKDVFKAALDGYLLWRETCLARGHRELVVSLQEHVLPVVSSARFENAVASFDDLLFRAAELLRDPAARARLATRFDALLIDEVQDTDPIQAEIAALLARDPAADGAWLAAPPEPGRLFAVGDPKQSIYRFRRADVTVWSDLSDLIARSGSANALTQNFRSVPGIVEWVNHVFAAMPDFVPQVAWRKPASLDPVVVIDSDVDSQIEHAARHLFELKEGGATVFDPMTEMLRPMEWGDVMVLVPRWAKAPAVAALFERAGVEAIVEGGGMFFDGEEVRLALSGLRALDEPGDTEAIVHVLRGLFGFTFEDLAAHVSKGGAFRYTIPEQPVGPVRDALEMLRDLRNSRVDSWVPPLDRLLEETRAAAVWSLMTDERSRLANLDKLRALIRETEQQTRSPSQVITELVDLSKNAKEEDLSRADPDTQAVRITSTFKAKGLEAPIVVLLDQGRTKPSPSVVAHRHERSVSVKIGAAFAPPGWEATKEAEVVELLEERRRWMYVACTRARDQLVIVHYPQANLLEFIEAGFDATSLEHESTQTIAPGASVRVRVGEELPALVLNQETFPGRDAAVDTLIAKPAREGDPVGEAWAHERRQALRASKRACRKQTSVGQMVSGSRAPVWGSGIGTAGGIVVHRVLEELDLEQAADVLDSQIDPLAHAFAVDLGASKELADRAADVVRRILLDPVLEEVRAAPVHWKETPFALQERNQVIHGVIDLCFPEDMERKSWVVVDWKSDLPPVGHPVRAKYEAQVAIYARAVLATISPCEKVRAVLVGPHAELPSEPEEETVVSDVHPELRAGLQALLTAGAKVPRVGVDVGVPVIANLEVAWEDDKAGLGLDLLPEESVGLEQAGWRVVAADTAVLGWARLAIARLRELLALPELDEDADDPTSAASTHEAAVAEGSDE